MCRTTSEIDSKSNWGTSLGSSMCQVLMAPAPSNGSRRSSRRFSSNRPLSFWAVLVTTDWIAPAKSRKWSSSPLVGAENLCHQAIFMDHASGAVTPLNPEMVQVGYAVGQRAQWRGLPEGPVRPVGVVKVLVLPQHRHQVTLVPDQGPVQQLTSAAADPPLHDRIGPHRQLHPVQMIGTSVSG